MKAEWTLTSLEDFTFIPRKVGIGPRDTRRVHRKYMPLGQEGVERDDDRNIVIDVMCP